MSFPGELSFNTSCLLPALFDAHKYSFFPRCIPVCKILLFNAIIFASVYGRTIRKLMAGVAGGGGGGGGVAVEVQKKYSRKGKANEKNSCTLINPKRYSRYGLKKLIQGIPAARKSPSPPPHNFSNGPSLKATVTRHLSSPTAWLVMTTHCHD